MLLKMSKRNCFAFYAFYAFKKCRRGIACLLFMLFMSEGLFVYFLCYLWVKVACLLFNTFWAYKNIWMKVACLHFVFFMLFLCIKSFCKKTSEIISNDLIYITTVLTCSRANVHAYVLTCQRALRACLRAHVPTCFACLCAHVPTCLACSRANVLCGLTCSRDISKISFQ